MFRLSTAKKSKKRGWIAVEIALALLLAYRCDGNAAAARRAFLMVVLAAVAKDNDSIAFSPRNEIPVHAARPVWCS